MLRTLVDVFTGNSSLDFFSVIFMLLSYAVILFVTLPVHEMAHAWTAYRLGDDTAKWYGRLSFNPLKHLDLVGTLMILLVGVGYAKPVPVNPMNFKNRKGGMALTALAGPASNLVMAIAAVGLYRVLSLVLGEVTVENGTVWYYSEVSLYLYVFLVEVFASINISLAVFNLLPVPPLDGTRIFGFVLPDRFNWWMERNSRIILPIFYVVLLTGSLSGLLSSIQHGVGGLICAIFGLPNLF